MKVYEGPFEYVGLHGRPARCDLAIHRTGSCVAEDRTFVVVASEPQDYEGLSVTNGIEKIATAVVREWPRLFGGTAAPDRTRFLWLEHYPEGIRWRGRKPEAFALVTFALRWPEPEYRTPVWRHVDRAWVEQLVGQEL